MAARIQSIGAGSSEDPAINSLIDFAKNGFGDTQMFGLIARRPELLKRSASNSLHIFGNNAAQSKLR